MPNSALLIVDMLSPYDFPGAESLAAGAPHAVERINRCREIAREREVPIVFANDIHDSFSGSRESVYDLAMRGEHPELVSPLEPREGESFLHKGQHSAFYGTPMAHLLHEWEIDEVVLTGAVTEQCILYTAFDVHVRHYEMSVLTDCVLPIEADLGDAALRMMEQNLGADLLESTDWNP